MTTPKRRFIYYFAMSADGFIARPDGSVDWLETRPAQDYGFSEFLATIDTVVWGRRTYDAFGSAPGALDALGPTARHIVLTGRPLPDPRPPQVEAATDVAALARELRARPGKDVWVMGGGASAAALLDAGALDELFVHVVPVVLGEGIPLFPPRRRDLQLSLLERPLAFPDGVVRLRYGVGSSEPS